MKKILKRIALTAGALILGVLLFAGYVIDRIFDADKVTQLTPEKNILKYGAIEIADIRDVDTAPFLDYLRRAATSPVDYVVAKFQNHDVIMLGESHQVREDCELVSQLIEPIYRRAGVRILAMEFVKHKREMEVNELLNAKVYDAERVTRIFREDFFNWGFKEYMDILRSVWHLNQSLTPSEERFKVIGLMPDIDYYKVTCGSLLEKMPEIFVLLNVEASYAQPVIEDVLDKHQKVLVQVGYYHTFLHYRQAKVAEGKLLGELARIRFGEILWRKSGQRVFQIALHNRHDEANPYTVPPRNPVLSLVETLWLLNGSTEIGFDIEASPFALLRDTVGNLFKFQRHVTLSDIAEGYILQKPFERLSCVEWKSGFVDASNFQKLRTFALQQKMISSGECNSPDELERRFSDLLKEGRRFN